MTKTGLNSSGPKVVPVGFWTPFWWAVFPQRSRERGGGTLVVHRIPPHLARLSIDYRLLSVVSVAGGHMAICPPPFQ